MNMPHGFGFPHKCVIQKTATVSDSLHQGGSKQVERSVFPV
jgi:hypothetical protein